MRIRTIKPSFFTNEELAACSPLARLAFIGLWLAADREGRLEDRPGRLKVEILPYDDADMDEILRELEGGDFIIRYEAEGKPLLAVKTFTLHQRITGSEADSKSSFPPPPAGFKAVKERVEKKVVSPVKSVSLEEFEVFWKAYPRKVSKGHALRAWAKNGRPELPVVLAAVEAQKRSEQWQKEGGKFIPHPATWLNGRRWEDEAGAAVVGEAGDSPPACADKPHAQRTAAERAEYDAWAIRQSQ